MKKTREDYRIIPFNDGYVIEVRYKFLCFTYWKIVEKLIFIPDYVCSFDFYETVFLKTTEEAESYINRLLLKQ